MTEAQYFAQFAGDSRIVPAYFVFSEGSADYGALDRDDCEEAYNILRQRYPTIQFEIRVINVVEGEWNPPYG